MEQEEIAADAVGLDVRFSRRAGDGDRRRRAGPGVLIEAAALGRFERGVDHGLIELLPEGADGGDVLRLVDREVGRDLRESLFALAAPAVCRLLRAEQVPILGQPRGTEHRKGRERDVQDQEQQRFPAGALQLFPGLFLARGLRRFGLPRRFKPAAHPLSASFTCVPASIGLVEVVMTNSPAPMPEMADIVSSCASTCTGTRVAV